MSGTLYIIAAPSGCGKTSLVNRLVSEVDKIIISISTTTRTKREKEEAGVHYNFVTESEFKNKVHAGEFLEYAEVFGHFYGTSKTWVSNKLSENFDVILEIDYQGAQQVRKLFPESVSIFILPPSIADLRDRLEKREQDKPEVIERRLLEASLEISHAHEFDYLVVNDVFESALDDLKSIVRSQRLKRDNRLDIDPGIISKLLG